MIVQAYGGLANRLRVLLSYSHVYSFVRPPLMVVWEPNGEIAYGRFQDVFCGIRGVILADRHPSPDVVTCDPSPASPGDWEVAYTELMLAPAQLSRWVALVPGEPFTAVHVRRTDHRDYEPARLDPTRDDEFLAFVETAHHIVFLATDNGTTQRAYARAIERTGRRVVTTGVIDEHVHQDASGQRNTTLADAAIDLFMCARADEFMGSRHSSFTNAIHTMRRLTGGWWA